MTHGTPIAYLISGDYQYENNLRMIIEGRSEVGGNYLCGVATDEGNTTADIQTLADSLVFALEKKAVTAGQFLWCWRNEDLSGSYLCHAGYDESQP